MGENRCRMGRITDVEKLIFNDQNANLLHDNYGGCRQKIGVVLPQRECVLKVLPQRERVPRVGEEEKARKKMSPISKK
ncbi:hypothetical protein JHK84_045595 [Glycine max]|nr:hypothetical protein JHK84_045595 [Glycine max]